MQVYVRPFSTNPAESTGSLATTAASQSIALATGVGNRSIRLVNSGADITFIRFNTASNGGAAAAATSMPLLPNTVETFFLARDVTSITAIGSAGGNTLYYTYGESA